MTPTKFLIGQILVVFAIMIGGVWLATQMAAANLGYGQEESIVELIPFTH